MRDQIWTQVFIPTDFWPLSERDQVAVAERLLLPLQFCTDVSLSPWRRLAIPSYGEFGELWWEEVYERAGSGFVEVP